MKETIIYLGWFINTRTFIIGLPMEKVKAWTSSIVSILKSNYSEFKELATLVGQLEHVCNVLPSARHFMNRTRQIAALAGKKSVKIPDKVKKDLVLWIKFINKAKEGISINNIIFRYPNSAPITDSRETGIGGYSLTSKILWSYQFTIEEKRSFTLNTEEYIGSVIGAYFAPQDDKCSQPCILSLSDSSSTVSWLHKSNHNPNSSPIHNAIARWHAKTS